MKNVVPGSEEVYNELEKAAAAGNGSSGEYLEYYVVIVGTHRRSRRGYDGVEWTIKKVYDIIASKARKQ